MEIRISVNTTDKELANEIVEFLEDLKIRKNFETSYEIKDQITPAKQPVYTHPYPAWPNRNHLYQQPYWMRIGDVPYNTVTYGNGAPTSGSVGTNAR